MNFRAIPFFTLLVRLHDMMRGHDIRSDSEHAMSRSYGEKECLTQRERRQMYPDILFYPKLQIFFMKLIECSYRIFLVLSIL